MNAQLAITVLPEPSGLLLVPMEHLGTFLVLHRYPNVMLVYQEGYVREMPHQYPSTFHLVLRLALRPAFLVPLVSFATSPL